MDTKLTLKLDKSAIEQAKRCASHRGVSVSRLVETYFLQLADREETHPTPTGVVGELAGILAGKEIALSREGRARNLARKYS